jgi:hypothetical protein
MGNRRKILTTALMAVLVGPAVAGPFDRSPRAVGIAVSDRLRLAGLDLRYELEWCERRELIECRFSSARTSLVATGRAEPPRTGEIMMASDLLATDAASDVHDHVAEALSQFLAADRKI